MKIIGRKKEREKLAELYGSSKPEFLAVYGRRRVGKTFLITETFKKDFVFSHAAISPVEGEEITTADQIHSFYLSLRQYGLKETKEPDNWFDCFFMLQKLLDGKRNGKKQVLFIDELPWLDTKHSKFISALENFWNKYGCFQDDLLLIVSGSSNSWIVNKLINNKGGLYDRVTYEMKLSPFTLNECEEFLVSNGVHYSRYEIVQAYMVFGGIPFYLGFIDKKLSLAQNIDSIFFSKEAKLRLEFNRLFSATFDNSLKVSSVVKFLSTRNCGYTRDEICSFLKLKSGGGISELLDGLLSSDLVMKYVPYKGNKRYQYYRLIDPFCIFYLRFVENVNSLNTEFYSNSVESQSIRSWMGIGYENVCFNHISQIKRALGINGISSTQSIWYKKGTASESGHQIDLVIDRKDGVINLCEVKFCKNLYSMDKDDHLTLMDREDDFLALIEKRKHVNHVLITTFGIKNGGYSSDFTNVITLDELFER